MSEQQYRVIADRDALIRHYAECIRKGDDPEVVLRVALAGIERPVPTTDRPDLTRDRFSNDESYYLATGRQPSLPTREQIAETLYSFSGDWQLYRIPWSKQGHEGVRKALLDRADAVLALLQKGADR